MQRTIRRMFHPEVLIDPQKRIPQLSLNNLGRSRTAALAKSHPLIGIQSTVSRVESKAIKTVSPLAEPPEYPPTGASPRTSSRMRLCAKNRKIAFAGHLVWSNVRNWKRKTWLKCAQTRSAS